MQNRLKEILQEKNLSQTDIAKALGVTRQAISLYENGKRGLKLKTWQKLAQLFAVPVAYLQGLNETWFYIACFDCSKTFRVLSDDVDELSLCPFCKGTNLSISKD